jgi:hypothetical protein
MGWPIARSVAIDSAAMISARRMGVVGASCASMGRDYCNSTDEFRRLSISILFEQADRFSPAYVWP